MFILPAVKDHLSWETQSNEWSLYTGFTIMRINGLVSWNLYNNNKKTLITSVVERYYTAVKL